MPRKIQIKPTPWTHNEHVAIEICDKVDGRLLSKELTAVRDISEGTVERMSDDCPVTTSGTVEPVTVIVCTVVSPNGDYIHNHNRLSLG